MIAEKQLLLDSIKQQIDGSCAMLVTSYNALSPSKSWALSKELSKGESSFEVVKKRILQKALDGSPMQCSIEELEKHIGVVFIKGDYLEGIKTVVRFNKDNNGLLKIIKGLIDGKVCSSKEVEMLSTLPNLEIMRADFLGLLEAPMSQTLSVMESMLKSVPYCVQNKLEKESK